MTYPIEHRYRPEVLYEDTLRRVSEREKVLDLVKDICVCRRSVAGPSYFKKIKCRLCNRTIRPS